MIYRFLKFRLWPISSIPGCVCQIYRDFNLPSFCRLQMIIVIKKNKPFRAMISEQVATLSPPDSCASFPRESSTMWYRESSSSFAAFAIARAVRNPPNVIESMLNADVQAHHSNLHLSQKPNRTQIYTGTCRCL